MPQVLLGFIVLIGCIGGVLICGALVSMAKGGYGRENIR